MPTVNTRSDLAQSHHSRLLFWALILNPIDALAHSLPVAKPAVDRQRVLFARLDGIGDYLLWTTAFDAIRAVYPSDRFERILVGNELWRDIVEPGMFDETLFVNTKRFVIDPRYRFRMMRQVRRFAADIAINPRLTREFLWNDSVIRVSGAATRIGTHGISNRLTDLQKRISDKWYTRLLPPPRDGEHETRSYLEFVEQLNSSAERVTSCPPSLGTANDEPDATDDPYCVLFLGAQIADKQWPVEKFVEVSRRLSDRGLSIVIAGGPSEKELSERFGELFGMEFRNMVGRTSLPQLAELINNAEIIVTNDTGAGHIAIATDTPVVVVTPGNHIGRFFPYPDEIGGRQVRQWSAIEQMECFGCRWDCIFTERGRNEPTPCIGNVSIETVMRYVDDALRQV